MSRTIVLNAFMFQLGWLVCVMGGDRWALSVGVALLAAHWLWVSRDAREWLAIAFGAGFGIVVDASLHALQLFRFDSVTTGVPWWLAVLWLLFMTTLNHSLALLQRLPRWAAVLGAVGGPASYYGGVALDAAQFGMPVLQALLVLAGVWALLLPLLVQLMKFRRLGVLA